MTIGPYRLMPPKHHNHRNKYFPGIAEFGRVEVKVRVKVKVAGTHPEPLEPES
jgi:hypothetical protein